MMSSRITVEDLRDAYDAGVQDSMLRATQYERILTDLIAELRDIYEDMGGGWDLKEATDRAEARLREVQGERPNMP